MPETRYFVLPDQRQVAYGIYGAQDAASTVFYFHGCPSSHHEAFLLSEAGRRHGLRIIAPSRPGSGGSAFRENGTLLEYADDVLALADHLDVPRFGIVAVSGGAPYAFACRKRIPRTRLTAVGIVAGIYPVTSFGTAGMKLPSRVMLRLATWFPSIVAWAIDRQLGAVARDEDGKKKLEALLVADMQQEATWESDKLAWEAAAPEAREAVVMGIREGVRYGGRGPAWEMKLYASHWGFELDEVRPGHENELVLWHGDLDANVPLAMAEKAARQLGPDAGLRVVEGQGHGALTFHRADEIMSTMRDNMLRAI
ncbi:hypothetical protein MYCTH_2309637 [Thermothelomyces thermophilus ATCC 42464]|uniref:Uncharacterized protein n=1 Tax=Thermothelomyces thermophilus (strain ATCC 42464 / BCRC 31852 / DSM 1799) TaxID=573729 RepID=G2QJ17_THET4|nr:uncharacterized protein MYCTH_2309637 [Thermothelomyces thermophilus ATCC 42464]AEO60436.1 hypothetical protein MYCTH_2309637 [Thermothelomyces thermophilus ATCC 42464]